MGLPTAATSNFNDTLFDRLFEVNFFPEKNFIAGNHSLCNAILSFLIFNPIVLWHLYILNSLCPINSSILFVSIS